MQDATNRLRWAVLPVALRVVAVVTLGAAALSFLAFHIAPRANATGHSFRMIKLIAGAISSSPYSGPVGTTISVSGSGWGGTDGTPVTFGYEVNSNCQIVSDSQNGTLSGGAFSGWFRWPSGTALNTFRVCALLGNVMEVAGSFSVLSSNPPVVAVSPSSLAPNAHATITASNYYPAGTQVNFSWMSGGTVIENLGSVTSNTSGQAILTFTVPKLSIGNGSYSVNATTGGQPPALFSSSNFTYTAPGASPSPTPRPSPTPSPTMTPSPTTTATVTPTATASVTATSGTPTASTSPTAGNGQTPTTSGTGSANNGSNTGTPTSSSSNNSLLIGGVAIIAGALLFGLVLLLLVLRRRKAARPVAKRIPPRLPASAGETSWVNPQGITVNNGAMPVPMNNSLPLPGNPNPVSYPIYNPLSGPGIFTPPPANMPVMPVPVGAGAAAGNGSLAAPAANSGAVSLQPPAWLTTASSNANAPAAAGNAPPTVSISADPVLDAMRRQAQSGLFVSPRPFKDGRS